MIETIKKESPLEVYLVIVSYNFEPWIASCLGSLRESSFPVHPVVVDNCSTDKTVKIIKRDYPEVRLIENNNNQGFGLANNIGMAYALAQGADYVFLLNQDAWIGKKTIERLLIAFEKHPDFGLLSPIHLDSTGRRLDRGFAHYSNLPEEVNPEQFNSEQIEVISANFINAAFWMIPVRILEEMGGFSPLFFYCGEDLDWVNRLKFHDYKLGYVNTAYGCHDRENRKSTHDSSPAYHLCEYLNIRYSFGKAFMMAIPALIKKWGIELWKGNLSKASFFMKACIQITLKSIPVIRIRRRVKTKGLHFIEVNPK